MKFASIGAAILIVAAVCAYAGEPSGPQPVKLYHTTVVRETTPPTPPEKQTKLNAAVLENRYLKVLVAPEIGLRIFNIVDKIRDRELIYDGGIFINHPYYHSGSPFRKDHLYTARVREDGVGEIVIHFTSYPQLQRTTFTISLAPEEAVMRCSYRFENLTPYPMGFNPWFDACFRESDDIEFILPVRWVAEHWFGANSAEAEDGRFYRLDPWPVNREGVDLSHIKNVKQLISVFGYGLLGGYSGVYYHKSGAGCIRIFDPAQMQAAKAFALDLAAEKRIGFIEIWGAFSHNMEDPLWIGPHEVRTSQDGFYPISGLGGVTWAGENGAIFLERKGQNLEVGVSVPRDYGRCAVNVVVDGQPLLQESAILNPATPFRKTIALPGDNDEVRLAVVDASGKRLIEHQKFLAPRPEPAFTLPPTPWHRRTDLAFTLWEEAHSPIFPHVWYNTPKRIGELLKKQPEDRETQIAFARIALKDADSIFFIREQKTANADYMAQAKAILEKLSSGPQADHRAIYLLGLLQMQQGERDNAQKTLRSLIKTPGETSMVHFLLALLATDSPRKAIDHASRAVALSPESTLPRQLLAIKLLQQKKPEEAIDVLTPLHQADPTEVATLELLRRAAVARGAATDAESLGAEIQRHKAFAERGYEACMRQFQSLENGMLLDSHAIKPYKP